MPRSFDASLNGKNRGEAAFRGRADSGYRSLIDELEASVANRDIGGRAEILRRLTNLFVAGSGGFSQEQLVLFDDVMCRLIDKIESSARAAFGSRIAELAEAPPRICRMLALDDSIEVARPLLSMSETLDDETLVEGARTKSQQHLLAISQRKNLSNAVTDVLVERGNREVVVSTAGNSGAQFSDFGYSTLVSRSEGDGELALKVWSRPEIPREHLLTLFTVASEAVRLELEAVDRKKAVLVHDMIKQASDRIQTKIRAHSSEYRAAEAQVRLLNQSGALNEHQLRKFAQAGKFDETTIALSLMCNLPIGVIERVLVNDAADQVLVLAKSIGLSWTATSAILRLQATVNGVPAEKIEQHFDNFNRLKPETARTAIDFYRLRERAASPKDPQR